MIYSGTIETDGIKRQHIYEGASEIDIVEDIKRAKRLVVVSAVGSLNPRLTVGDAVLITDLITLFYKSTWNGPSFIDLSQPFDKNLTEKARKYIKKEAIHVFMRGPHYETFADKQALRMLGADVVGMSMTPEVISANRLGIPVVGIGIVTNDAFVKHSHEFVKSEADKAIAKMKDILSLIDRDPLPYLLDEEEIDGDGIIDRAMKYGYEGYGGIYQTSVASEILRSYGHTVTNNPLF
jgi:purine nucleoside phosphorylase